MAIQAIWQKIADSNDIRRSSQTISLSKEHVLLFGGEVKPRQPVNNTLYQIPLNVHDSSQDRVAALEVASAPSPRVGSASTTLDGKTYLFSGRGGEAMAPIEEHGAIHIMDNDANKWSVLKPADSSSPYPQARSYHTMTSDGRHNLYIHAGCPEKGRLADLWAFNLNERRWKQLVDAPGPQRGGTSITYLDGKLYRMNGFDGTNEQGYALDAYDVSSNSWSTATWNANSGPSPRSVSTLFPVRINGEDALLTMFGECDPSNLGHQGAGKMLSDVWVYEIDGRRWTKVEPQGEKPDARGWFAADVMHEENQVVLQGGLAEDNTRLGDAWVLSF